ncbi:MAG: hypothetical protein A3F43_04615 [Gammaproteobacteria bacterium RIFCSPHIGHO2_12_FULL_42_10]|nr:MAG: hypothetical protein A3F43_04615 [Gammaproteobacteria bacterium RIFCSPHIGHO2_12_FULL_42_10]
MILHLIFYAFATIAVFSALMVITARHPIRSVLSLVVTFFAMASIWMLLHAEFLSLILLLVYVGAVMTLFLFVVMMLASEREKEVGGFVRYWPFCIVSMILLIGIVTLSLAPAYFGLTSIEPQAFLANDSNTQQLGVLLYTDYAYPFEIAGVVLLAAIIASIALTHRPPHERRSQRISEQIAANPATRLRLVKSIQPSKQGENK